MSAPAASYNRDVGSFIRSLIVLNRTYRSRDARTRLHTIVRFLTCPFNRLIDHVPRDARVLDIGAGHGVFSVLAKNGGAKFVVAVEPDLRKVRKIDGIDFVVGFDDVVRGEFDVIAVVDVLYKIPLAQWDPLFARIASRLAPHGTIIIKEQDPTARLKNTWNRLQERIATALHLTLGESFSYEAPDAFVARMKRHGFESVDVRKIDGGYPHPHIAYIIRRTKS
jgi:2-polyprenyl-3-methyl-5-hydroxy-6-metoxy-1,4-benzoquinol methylase